MLCDVPSVLRAPRLRHAAARNAGSQTAGTATKNTGKKLGEKVSDKIKEFFEKNKKVFIWVGVGIALLVLLGAGISSCSMITSTGSSVIASSYLEYVCVNEIGDLIKPHYVTESFPKLLKAKGMRQIRYHDLRHSCASLLLANGVPMKQIQEWLGHSDFSTTANIYAHLDYSSKLTSADAMLNGLGFAAN